MGVLSAADLQVYPPALTVSATKAAAAWALRRPPNSTLGGCGVIEVAIAGIDSKRSLAEMG